MRLAVTGGGPMEEDLRGALPLVTTYKDFVRLPARWRETLTGEVLVLGDSFMRIYQLDPPGRAGFVAHLALELRCTVAGIVNDGGGSTLVRQDLFRRPRLLSRAKVVMRVHASRSR